MLRGLSGRSGFFFSLEFCRSRSLSCFSLGHPRQGKLHRDLPSSSGGFFGKTPGFSIGNPPLGLFLVSFPIPGVFSQGILDPLVLRESRNGRGWKTSGIIPSRPAVNPGMLQRPGKVSQGTSRVWDQFSIVIPKFPAFQRRPCPCGNPWDSPTPQIPEAPRGKGTNPGGNVRGSSSESRSRIPDFLRVWDPRSDSRDLSLAVLPGVLTG